MPELQAAIDFQVELNKFFNVDLFQRGYYQLRLSLKYNPKTPLKLEVALPHNDSCDLIFPASIMNGAAISKTFQVLYRNEDVSINDVVLFKIQMLVDSQRVEECLDVTNFQLLVELWFTDEEVGQEYQDKLVCVSSRMLSLHLDPSQGLHHHVQVLFDYFHLCAVTMTVHGTLLALHQPYINMPGRPLKYSSKDLSPVENLYFGSSGANRSSGMMTSQQRLREAIATHKIICNLLLSAHESLQKSYQGLTNRLHRDQPTPKIDFMDCHQKLESIMKTLQKFRDEEDFLPMVQSDVAQLCAQNVILWSHYKELVTLNEDVTHQLARDHHLQRIKRFAEGFFTQEYPKAHALKCFDPLITNHAELTNLVRSSQYFQNIPALPAECLELDGDVLSLPVIFEDIFREDIPAKKFVTSAAHRLSSDPLKSRQDSLSSSSSTSSSSPRFKRSSKLSFIKNMRPENMKRPSDVLNENSSVRREIASNVAGVGYSGATLVGFKKLDPDTPKVIDVPPTQTICREGTPLSRKGSQKERVGSQQRKAETHAKVKSHHSSNHASQQSSKQYKNPGHQLSESQTSVQSQPNIQSEDQLPRVHAHVQPVSQPTLSFHSSDEVMHVRGKVPVYDVGASLCGVLGSPLYPVASMPSLIEAPGSSTSYSGSLPDLTPCRWGDEVAASKDSGLASASSQWEKINAPSVNALSDCSKLTCTVFNDAVSCRKGENVCNEHIGSPPNTDRQIDNPYAETLDNSQTAESTDFSSKENTDCCSEENLQSGLNTGRSDSGIGADQSINSGDRADSPEETNILQTSSTSESVSVDGTGSQGMSASTELFGETVVGLNDVKVVDDQDLKLIDNGQDLKVVVDGQDLTMGDDGQNVTGIYDGQDLFVMENLESIQEDSSVFEGPSAADDEEELNVLPSGLGEEEMTESLHRGGESLTPVPEVICEDDVKVEVNQAEPSVTFEEYIHVIERLEWQESSGSVEEEVLELSVDAMSEEVEMLLDESGADIYCSRLQLNTAEDRDTTSNNHVIAVSTQDSLAEDDGYLTTECTLLELLQEDFDGRKADVRRAGKATNQEHQKKEQNNTCSSNNTAVVATKELVCPVPDKTISFITAKEKFRKRLLYQGHWYSDYPAQASTSPYFWPSPEPLMSSGVHLIVCVHGLEGNSADLRLVKTYLELCLPNAKMDFLMSERNQPNTFADLDVMTDKLVDEILCHIEAYGLRLNKLSFVGHSMGNLIIRSALAQPRISHLLPLLHTLLSLSGPHLGTLYNTSGLVNMGMWFMQKWKKSGSLLQLSLKDHVNLRETFIYKLSQKPGLGFFKNVLFVSSLQDRYVPYHSSRIEICKSALRDTSGLGSVYCEMVHNLLQPLIDRKDLTLIRYDVFHALQNTANNLIGRAAHIAVLDSEIFIEKFLTVAALKYFK